MSYVLAFFVGFLTIVIVHELGHFIAAKKMGIKVLEFSLFIGPRIYSFKRKETTYSLRLIPILAYVKLEGEDESSESSEAYYKKPKYARIITSAGGPAANILLAIVLLTIVFSIQGFVTTKVDDFAPSSPAISAGVKKGDTVVKYNGKRVYTVMDIMQFLYVEKGAPVKLELRRDGKPVYTTVNPTIIPESTSYMIGVSFKANSGNNSNVVVSITPGYPAESAGLKSGDRIVGINDTQISSREDIVNFMKQNGGREIHITALRSGRKITVNLVPKAEKVPESYDLGMYYTAAKGGILESMGQSAVFSWSIVRSVGYSLGCLITGKVSVSGFMGPVGMVSSIGSVVQQSPGFVDKLLNLLYMTSLLSIAIGATNLIPFPMLDGNKILLVLIEAVRGKPIPIEKEAYISMVGFVILILFAIYVTYNDIIRIVTG